MYKEALLYGTNKCQQLKIYVPLSVKWNVKTGRVCFVQSETFD